MNFMGKTEEALTRYNQVSDTELSNAEMFDGNKKVSA